MTYLPPFKHQKETADFWIKHPRCFCTSDPGTGKTRSCIDGFHDSYKDKRMLVIAPLSILVPSWGEDIKKFSGFDYAVAHGSPIKRLQAFESNAHIVLINHDGVGWLKEQIEMKTVDLSNFSHVVVDEFTAFKNKDTKRSKAMNSLMDFFEYAILLSGTPNSNTILDMWHPAFMLDRGARLGRQFYKFKTTVCDPKQVGPHVRHVQWIDKPNAPDMVADALMDITIRHCLEDCIDMPEHVQSTLRVDMPVSVMKAYYQMERTSALELEEGEVTAIHAGSKVKKMLQLLSGAVYGEDGAIKKVHPERYNLVMDLIEARDQCLVAFNWHHERDNLTALADKHGFTYGVIDGETKVSDRNKIVEQFQAGDLKVVFAHPQSAGHGLTLTKGTTTIWASPTYNAEHFQQFNRRIYRAGQTERTETICIAARGTKEEDVYERLNGKLGRMEDILAFFAQSTEVNKDD